MKDNKLAARVQPKGDAVRKRGGSRLVRELKDLAEAAVTAAQWEAYNQGIFDRTNGTRDHPPYGFSDLQKAWKAGFLAASGAGKRVAGGQRGR